MNTLTSNFNRVRNVLKPANVYRAIDIWVWGPKEKRDYNTYYTRVYSPTFKNNSRMALVCLILAGIGLGAVAGFVWLVDHKPEAFWLLGGAPIAYWIAWTLKPIKRATHDVFD